MQCEYLKKCFLSLYNKFYEGFYDIWNYCYLQPYTYNFIPVVPPNDEYDTESYISHSKDSNLDLELGLGVNYISYKQPPSLIHRAINPESESDNKPDIDSDSDSDSDFIIL